VRGWHGFLVQASSDLGQRCTAGALTLDLANDLLGNDSGTAEPDALLARDRDCVAGALADPFAFELAEHAHAGG